MPLSQSRSFKAGELLDFYRADASVKHIKPYTDIIYDSPVYPVRSQMSSAPSVCLPDGRDAVLCTCVTACAGSISSLGMCRHRLGAGDLRQGPCGAVATAHHQRRALEGNNGLTRCTTMWQRPTLCVEPVSTVCVDCVSVCGC